MAKSDAPQTSRKEPLSKSLWLALSMHALLIVALALSTRWKSSEPAAIEAELWNATPQIAALNKAPPPPPPTPVPEVKPLPKPEPVVKAPEEPAPDIALEIKRKEEARKKQEQAQLEEKLTKLERDRLEKEKVDKLALDKKMLQAQKASDQKLMDDVRRDNEQRLARATGSADVTASPNNKSSLTAGKGSRFSLVATGKVKDNLNFPEEDYKPAIAMVTLAPDGTVLDVRFTKPSGNPAQDAAIERAIRRTARFPPENPGEAYRQVELEFKASN
jgi:colicin import membrane protein